MSTVALSSTAGKWILASAITASSMAFIDGTALNVVLPSIQTGINATGTDLFWILNGYLLMLAALMLIGGSLGDKIGRKKVFMVGIIIFITGSAACGFAPAVTELILFRMVQGIGGALMIPGSLALISALINKEERGKAIGTWSAFTTIVTVGGPILGGALADAGYWRFIFFINIPIGISALIILATRVHERPEEGSDRAIDYPGSFTIVSGLTLLTYGFLRIPAIGFNHWQVYSSLTAGIVMLVIFILIQKKSRHPMMPLSLFSSMTFSGANLLTFFLYAALGAGMLFLSLNLIQAQGYSQLQSGLTFLPFTILMILLGRFSGGLVDKYGPRQLLIFGPATAGAGLLFLSFIGQTSGPSEYWTTYFPGIVLFGLGMSFTVSPLTTTVMGAVSDRFSGTASGVNNAVSRISGVFANAIFGALAVIFFSGVLDDASLPSTLDKKEKQEVRGQAIELGNAKAPVSLTADEKEQVSDLYRTGFISSYRKILFISACLAFIGTLMSIVFIKNDAMDHENPSVPL